jgi:hypothetical protein
VEEVWEKGEALRVCQCRVDARAQTGIGRTVLMPVVSSSSGRVRTWSVICTRVRGMRRVRMMLRKVLCRRVSRWRSFGPWGCVSFRLL